MNKNSIIAILSILVGLLAITLIVVDSRNGAKMGSGTPPPEPTQKNVGETWVDTNGVTNVVIETKPVMDGKEPNTIITNTTFELAPAKRSVVRRTLEPEATKRLHDGPVIVSSVFEASGKAEHASYGTVRRGSYLYTTTVIASSEIISKKDGGNGEVFVEERRKFLQARDTISLSDLDIALALDTVPVVQIEDWVHGACSFVSRIGTSFSEKMPPAAMVDVAVKGFDMTVGTAFNQLQKIDGASARGMLGAFGVKIPENLEAFLNDKAAQHVRKELSNVHHALQEIEGKTFIITYTQEAGGETKTPLQVDFRHEDGKPISDAEWEILRSANAFLDSNIVPDAKTDCRIGDSWTIWADEIVEMFGMAGKGRTDGKISVERVDDQPDGSWTLKLAQSEIEYKSDNGESAGKMQVKDGNGLIDAKNASVKSLQATAGGNLSSLNKKRHFLFFEFVKRIKGDSNIRFTLTVEPAKVETTK